MKHTSNSMGVGGFLPTRRILTEEENKALMKEAHDNLKKRAKELPTSLDQQKPITLVPLHRIKPWTKRLFELEQLLGDKPKNWIKPSYGSIDYHMADRQGWISNKEKGRDEILFEERRERSLRTCNRYSYKWFSLTDVPTVTPTGSFTPETSAAILNDLDLSDGARRLALKLMEVIYRQNREGRRLETTVTYLAKMLGRHKRTIQNYMALLEYKGCIQTSVVFSKLTKMSVGLVISLGELLFPKHHKVKWPEKRKNSGVKEDSFKITHINNTELIPRNSWALRCMEGVYRALQRYGTSIAPPII